MHLSAEEEARMIASALNEIGHLASGYPLAEALHSLGEAKLREVLLESVTLCFELVLRTERGPNPEVFPRSAEAKAALSLMRDMLPALDLNDARSMASLRKHAREALNALGIQLSA